MPAVDEVASTGAVFSTVNIGGVDYRLAVFDEDGQLVVTEGGLFRRLLVAGGASGGGTNSNYAGGGGGGGGGVDDDEQEIGAGTYPVTVGAGGAVAGNAESGNDGEASAIVGVASVPGGGGGGMYGTNGRPGGSGGGSGGANDTTLSGGAGTVGVGNDGGSTTQAFNGVGAGGGGAGAAGANSQGSVNGYLAAAGGDGVLSDIDGTSTYYGGGGGGGAGDGDGGDGGLGGGGHGGGFEQNGTAGTDGLGGGGGGAGDGPSALGGAGGRGVVKLRWLPSGAPDEILADADITEDPDTLDAAATSAVQAASETHDVADTLNAEGTLAIQANLSAVDQADTLAGSAATALIAQAVITEAADSVLSTGGIEVVVGLDARFAPLEARVNRAMFRHLSNAVVSRSAGNEFRAILDVSDEPVDPLEGVQAGQARLTFPQQAPEVLEGEVITTLRLGVARQWRVIEDPRRQSDGVLVAVLAAA
jgi:hypothetical protein